jgi:hypothetical protein
MKGKKPPAKRRHPSYSGPIATVADAWEYLCLINARCYNGPQWPVPSLQDRHALEAVRLIGLHLKRTFKPIVWENIPYLEYDALPPVLQNLVKTLAL